MPINYGDLECSAFMIARAEREADASLDTVRTEGCRCSERQLYEVGCECGVEEEDYLDPVWDADEIDYRNGR